jgi:hypothetical protein
MKHFFSLSVLSLALATGAATAGTLHVEVPRNIEPTQSGLTRTEVIADYHLSRLAGLQDLTHGELSVDTNGYVYRKAFATYLHMRQSSQFADLVKELGGNPYAHVTAVRPSTPPVQASR